MAIPAIPPIGSGGGADFSLPPLDGAAAPSSSGGGFGARLADALGKLEGMQQDATVQSQALATGRATDVTSVVMAVERAQLSLEMASQIRNKAVDAYNEILRMQV